MFFGSFTKKSFKSGSGLIDVIIGASIVALSFVAILLFFNLQIKLITFNKFRSGVVVVMQDEIEYIRSLPYNDIGVQGSIPNGVIVSCGSTDDGGGTPPAQCEEVVIDGITYLKAVRVTYVDDPADGTLVAGTDLIPNDYKKVTVEVQFTYHNKDYKTTNTIIATPKGMETGEPNTGSLKVTVLDAVGAPVAGANVKMSRPDSFVKTALTNTDGWIWAPLSSLTGENTYKVEVSKNGYYGVQTYPVAGENVSPDPANIIIPDGVLTSWTTEMDRVASLGLNFYNQGEFVDDFPEANTTTDTAHLHFVNNMMIHSNYVRLDSVTDGSSGEAISKNTTSTNLHKWQFAHWKMVSAPPSGAHFKIQFVKGDDSLIPDADLTGNSTGWNDTEGVVDLSGLDISAYPVIKMKVSMWLDAGVDDKTPRLQSWDLHWLERADNTSFDIHGNKIKGRKALVGSQVEGDPIYRYDTSLNTGVGNNTKVLPSLEWDKYSLLNIAGGNKDIASVCPPDKLIVNPATTENVDIALAPDSNHSLRIGLTRQSDGSPIFGAKVKVYKSGYNETKITSLCGQAFFPLPEGGDYTIDIDPPAPLTPKNGQSVIVASDNGSTTIDEGDTVFLDSL